MPRQRSAPKKSLGGISKIVVLGQPAVLDTVEAVNSFDRPMAARFPCLGGMQHSELMIGRSVQDTWLLVEVRSLILLSLK